MMVSSGKVSAWLRAKRKGRSIAPCPPGQWMMEVAILLLLYVPLSSAVGVRHTQRTQTENLSLANRGQKTEVFAAVETHRVKASTTTGSPKTDLMWPAVPALLRNILNESIKTRSKRAGQKGCQFGTCQVHNLANMLYVMGQSNGKEQSKKVADPNGYGR